MIIAATYVDNQSIVQYPIETMYRLLNWCDKMIWFVGDKENHDVIAPLVKDKIEIIQIDQKIIIPEDIRFAQNKAVNWIKANTNTEFIFYQQADLLLTPHGEKIATDWIADYDGNTKSISLCVAQNKLFVELFDNPNGGVLFHKSWEYEAEDDGWFLKNSYSPYSYRFSSDPWNHPTLVNDARPMMDLGYITTDAYMRKLICHGKIWPDKEWKERLYKIYQQDKIQGIRETFKRIEQYEESKGKPMKIVEYKGQYKWLIDTFGFNDEYEMIKKITS